MEKDHVFIHETSGKLMGPMTEWDAFENARILKGQVFKLVPIQAAPPWENELRKEYSASKFTNPELHDSEGIDWDMGF